MIIHATDREGTKSRAHVGGLDGHTFCGEHFETFRQGFGGFPFCDKCRDAPSLSKLITPTVLSVLRRIDEGRSLSDKPKPQSTTLDKVRSLRLAYISAEGWKLTRHGRELLDA